MSVTIAIKNVLRPLVFRYRSAVKGAPWYRRMVTRNYSTGRVALGEQHKYGIPSSWITLDWNDADFVLDLKSRAPLPFADNSQDFVYSTHMVEHLDDETINHLLRECHRILKVGGGLRIEAPDAKLMVQAYINNDRNIMDYFVRQNHDNLVKARGLPEEYASDHIAFIGVISCYIEKGTHVPVLAAKKEVDEKVKNWSLADFGKWCVSLQTPAQMATGGHINALSFEKFSGILQGAGFAKIKKMATGVSDFGSVSLKRIERPDREFYSFIAEATK